MPPYEEILDQYPPHQMTNAQIKEWLARATAIRAAFEDWSKKDSELLRQWPGARGFIDHPGYIQASVEHSRLIKIEAEAARRAAHLREAMRRSALGEI